MVAKKKGRKKRKGGKKKKEELVCPNCGAWVSKGDEVCPICGYDLKGEVEAKGKGEKEVMPISEENEERMMKVLEWQARGYDTSYVEKIMEEGGDVERAFEEYERNVERLEDLMDKIMEIEADERLEDEVKEIREMLSDPMKVGDIESKLDELVKKIEINKLRDEIYELDTRGFEDEVAKIEEMMEKLEDMDEIKKRIKELRRKIKERFFEVEIERRFKPEARPRLRKIKIIMRPKGEAGPVMLKDLFIMHRDGTVLSHLTQRSKDELEKIKLPTLIHYIQTRVRLSDKGVTTSEYNREKIYINNGGALSIVLVMGGEKRKEIDELTSKALEMLENRYRDYLENWTGDASSLQYIDGYANVLLKVLNRMGA